MKKIIVSFCLLILMCFPATSSAAGVEDVYQKSLLDLIQLLLKQIEVLKIELAEQQSKSVHVPSVDELMVSQFYDGTYLALYATSGTTLYPIGRTHLSDVHQSLWDGFVTLVGERFAMENVQEFRLYSSRGAEFDAFTELDTKTGKWIFAVNLYGVDMAHPKVWEELNPLFIHEIGHIIITDSMIETFTARFWDTEGLVHAARVEELAGSSYRDAAVARYFDLHGRDFVTEYAATSPLEDIVESFVAYVMDTKTFTGGDRVQKIVFFEEYPELLSLRARIQAAL